MKETQELKRIEFVGYRLENGIYLLVDFKANEILDTMDQVAILFDDDVLLKHGNPDKIYKEYQLLKTGYSFVGIDHNLHIIQGPIPIEELDKMLSITGYKPKINGLEST